jgi:hypothetical protein
MSLVPRRWGACLVALLLGLLGPGIAQAAGRVLFQDAGLTHRRR